MAEKANRPEVIEVDFNTVLINRQVIDIQVSRQLADMIVEAVREGKKIKTSFTIHVE